MGVVGMTREHLGLTLALSVPVFVVVTKVLRAHLLSETPVLVFVRYSVLGAHYG